LLTSRLAQSLRSLRTALRLACRAAAGASWRDARLAFLLGAFGSLGDHRQAWRAWFLERIVAHARNQQIELRLRIRGRVARFAFRQGNMADLYVAAELIKGSYALPPEVPETILDGGANIGLFTIWAHAWFPRAHIVCYEPDRENLLQLQRNCELNRLAAEIHAQALWSHTTMLYYHARSSFDGYVDEEPPGIAIPGQLPEIPRACWLKLDIEGGEYTVLPTLLRQCRLPGWITMEIHDFENRGQTLLRALRQQGYRLGGDVAARRWCVTISARHAGWRDSHPALE
jgi:FkbM family methyltransferase